MSDDIASRMALFRSEIGLSQRALAKTLDVSQGLVAAVESGRVKPSGKMLRRLAETHRVSSDWVLYGKGEMFRLSLGLNEAASPFHGSQLQSQRTAADRSDQSVRLAGHDLSLIRRGRINTGEGAGLVLHDEPMSGALAFDTNWLAKKGVSSDLALLIEAADDTMAPTIPDGALVLVHISEMYATEPGIYAVVKDGRPALRRITPVAGNEGPRPPLMVQSDADPAPELLSGDDLTRLRIVGRVRVVVGAL